MIVKDKAVIILKVSGMFSNLVAGYSVFYLSPEQFHKQVKRK